MEDVFLEKYLDSYSAFLTSIGGLSSLCFAVSAFFLSRGIGIISDENVAVIVKRHWLFLSLVTAIISVVAAFLAEAQIASFYDDMFQKVASPGCTMDISTVQAISLEAAYFQLCTRSKLGIISVVCLVSALLSVLFLAIWLITQSRRSTQ